MRIRKPHTAVYDIMVNSSRMHARVGHIGIETNTSSVRIRVFKNSQSYKDTPVISSQLPTITTKDDK